MIQVKELRIGSTYKWGDGIATLSQQDLRDILELEEIENIYPIELTEDILIKCGFKDMSFPGLYPEYTLLSDELNLATIEYDSEMNAVWLCFEGTICGKKLKHLHQLQNLYFDLTGEELQIAL
jgi:hypothetical protein